MPRPSSAFVRLLLRAYPRHLRIRERDALEAACIECLARERGRLGRLGVAYAWGRLIADTITAAILLRVDERRRRRLAWHSSRPFRPEGDPDDSTLAGRQVRRAPPAARADVQSRRDCHAGVDDRRHDRRLHGRQRRPAARAAIPRSRPVGPAASDVPDDAGRLFAARLCRVRGARGPRSNRSPHFAIASTSCRASSRRSG